MRVDILDPPAYSLPYDGALAQALAAQGAEVRLLTSRFAYGEPPPAYGYIRAEAFYRHARGRAGSPLRAFGRRAEHPLDIWRYQRYADGPGRRDGHGRPGSPGRPDVAHFQWLALPRLDLRLMPHRCPVVLTIHDPLERGRVPGRHAPIPAEAFRRVDAVIVHSAYARDQVIARHGLEPAKVHVIRHGVLASAPDPPVPRGAPDPDDALDPDGAPDPDDALPPELRDRDDGRPVVLSYGLLRPYKGLATLLAAWRETETDAQLWVVGRAMMDLDAPRRVAPASVSFLPRFVTAAEERALLRRADIVVLPYERSDRFGFSGVLATALGAGRAIVLSDVGGLRDVADAGAAELVPAGEAAALGAALRGLLDDPARREELAAAARAAAAGDYSWDTIARQTLALYQAVTAR